MDGCVLVSSVRAARYETVQGLKSFTAVRRIKKDDSCIICEQQLISIFIHILLVAWQL